MAIAGVRSADRVPSTRHTRFTTRNVPSARITRLFLAGRPGIDTKKTTSGHRPEVRGSADVAGEPRTVGAIPGFGLLRTCNRTKDRAATENRR